MSGERDPAARRPEERHALADRRGRG